MKVLFPKITKKQLEMELIKLEESMPRYKDILMEEFVLKLKKLPVYLFFIGIILWELIYTYTNTFEVIVKFYIQ